MLPRGHRLTDDYDFNRVKRLGKTYHTFLFSLTILRAKNPESPSRFGFIVSKRLDKRAVVRNRLKRLLREAVHDVLPKMPPGYEAVFFIRPGMKGKSYEEVRLRLDQLLPKTPLVEKPTGRTAFPYR